MPDSLFRFMTGTIRVSDVHSGYDGIQGQFHPSLQTPHNLLQTDFMS